MPASRRDSHPFRCDDGQATGSAVGDYILAHAALSVRDGDDGGDDD